MYTLLLVVFSGLQFFTGSHMDVVESSHSQDTLLLVNPNSIRIPAFQCLGWRETRSCDPNGPRDFAMDSPCEIPIEGGASGYCALQDVDTKQEVHAMLASCSSVRSDVDFTCDQVAGMARMSAELDRLIAQVRWDHRAHNHDGHGDTIPTKGIVMVVYPKLLVSVHATVRLLRMLGCALPIELWFLMSEMGRTRPIRATLNSLVEEYGPVTIHPIMDGRVGGFNTKIHAIINSELDQLLFLDADNIPTRDPTYLFTDSKAFNETGAVFWPDFWHPRHTIFNIHERSPLWEMIGTPFVDMFEQESGQILIDKRQAKVSGALAVLEYFAFHEPNYFAILNLLHGDKDLFRLAWMKTNTSFHMVPHPPASAGSTVKLAGQDDAFCGMTMVQFDPDASVNAGVEAALFMHRNGKKLVGDELDAVDRVWTHVQLFEYPDRAMESPEAQFEHVKVHFRVQIGGMEDAAAVLGTAHCYGDRELKSPHFSLSPASSELQELERTLLQLGREALELAGADDSEL